MSPTEIMPLKEAFAQLQELVRGVGGEPESLDPHRMNRATEGFIGYDLFEGLVTYDRNGNLELGQAESWAVSNNGKTYRFIIRDNLFWSDGRPITAEDFEYSYQRMVTPSTASPYAWFMEEIDVVNASDVIKGLKSPESLGIKAINKKVLEFNLNQPVNYFIQFLAIYPFLPVPRHAVERYGAKWSLSENMVTNGAFKLDQWRVNERIRVVRNSLYRANKDNKIDSVIYITNGDELARFRAGEIDMTNSLQLNSEEWVRKRHPDWLREEPWMSTSYVVFNLRKKLVSDVVLRRALAMALDRQGIANSRVSGSADAAWQFTPPHFPGLRPKLPEYRELNAKSRKAASVAIYKKVADKPKNINITYCSQSPQDKKLAIVVASQWQNVLGISVTLNGVEQQTFWSETAPKGQYDVLITRWIGPYKDASASLNLHRSKSAHNRSFYESSEYDELVNRARKLDIDNPERMQLYSRAESLLISDLPVIPILHHKQVRLLNKDVKGYTGKNFMGRIYSRHLFFE